MKEIFVERAQVAALVDATFPDYKGKKYRVVPLDSVTIMDLNWHGGTRSQYRGCTLAGERTGALDKWNAVAPWRNAAEGSQVEIPKGACLVKHSMFCGKDSGLTIYVHPDNMPGMLPAPVELTAHERIVLRAHKECKSSYNGKDRYELAAPYDYTWNKAKYPDYPSRPQWDAAKQSLISKGLLNSRGAITNEGRNAI